MNRLKANLKRVEVVLLLSGLALLAITLVAYIGGRVYSRMAVTKFHAHSTSQPRAGGSGLKIATSVDYTLWSPKRIQGYEATLAENFGEPLALLRIKKIGLEVPVFEGTEEPVLNRGVGRIAGTVHFGEAGNVGIAGHRDGFFRGLKDVTTGDAMELETRTDSKTYIIDSIRLVTPDDVSVLKNEGTPALTLVTCFPFYFVGSAPQRYIVHASLEGESKKMNAPIKATLQATASKPKENTQ